MISRERGIYTSCGIFTHFHQITKVKSVPKRSLNYLNTQLALGALAGPADSVFTVCTNDV